MMKKLLREPLLHFIVLGLVLFVIFEWRGGGRMGGGQIVVTAGQVDHLASTFSRARLRPPDGEDLKGLIDEYVKEEIATREAIAAGLDRDDAQIRRRLRQKLEFLAEDAVEQSPPSETDLQAWLDAHPDAVKVEPRFALRQVFLSPARRGARAPGDAKRELDRLRAAGANADVSGRGDTTMLPAEIPPSALAEVARIFGDDFARVVETLPVRVWSGPVSSTFGLHLVLVTGRVPALRPALAEVRPQVEREVIADRRRRAVDALYESLLAKYRVTVERPLVAPVTPAERGR